MRCACCDRDGVRTVALRSRADVRFLHNNGLIALTTRAQLEDLAARTGYRIASYEDGIDCSHALLAPA